VELRNDQVDPKVHEQAGEPKQDIAEREGQSVLKEWQRDPQHLNRLDF
jgi:hypothetical protein